MIPVFPVLGLRTQNVRVVLQDITYLPLLNAYLVTLRVLLAMARLVQIV